MGESRIEDRYYMVSIKSGPEDFAEDIFNPKCYLETYEEAAAIARPWVEQGYEVVITTKKHDEGDVEKDGI